MHLFYTPDIDPTHPQYFLTEEESKHAIRVMRLEVGSAVQLIDALKKEYKLSTIL